MAISEVGPGQGPVALVTGASEGIGSAIAQRLVAEGHRLALVARPGEKLTAVAERLGPSTLAVGCDLTSLSEIERAVGFVTSTFSRLDVLVNCGSATVAGEALALTDEQWVRGFDVKVIGSLRMIRCAWPHLCKSEGAVVNIGGIGARTPTYAYSMAGPLSAALMALTKVFAERGLVDGVRVNQINPGPVLTPRVTELLKGRAAAAGQGFEELVAQMVQRDGITRLGTPDDVAGLVAFLLSSAGEWLHGAIIDLDGGRTKGL